MFSWRIEWTFGFLILILFQFLSAVSALFFLFLMYAVIYLLYYWNSLFILIFVTTCKFVGLYTLYNSIDCMRMIMCLMLNWWCGRLVTRRTYCVTATHVEFQKSQVWEIMGAEFTRSNVHTAGGISIRFPRLSRIRDDKSVKQATDLPQLLVGRPFIIF